MTNGQLQSNYSLIHPFTHLRIHSLVNQIDQSMQNKPNFMKNRRIVSHAISRGYEIAPLVFGSKIPNPILPGVQMNLTPYITIDYRLKTIDQFGKNKPKQTQFKANFIRKTLGEGGTNPIQSQFQSSGAKMNFREIIRLILPVLYINLQNKAKSKDI